MEQGPNQTEHGLYALIAAIIGTISGAISWLLPKAEAWSRERRESVKELEAQKIDIQESIRASFDTALSASRNEIKEYEQELKRARTENADLHTQVRELHDRIDVLEDEIRCLKQRLETQHD